MIFSTLPFYNIVHFSHVLVHVYMYMYMYVFDMIAQY